MSKNISLISVFLILVSYSSFAQTNYITDFIDTIPPNTKEIIAWESEITEKGDTIISKSEYWKYDKNKNLISWGSPQLYGKVDKKYDNQNRTIRLEQYYGESSDNGLIFISYLSKNIITEKHEKVGHSALIKRQFEYNSKGKLIREEVYDSMYYSISKTKNHSEINNYVIVYKYDKNDNLINKNTFNLPKFTTRETIEYTYNKYNQILSKKTTYNYQQGSSYTSIIKYSYYEYLHKGETKPKIFLINRTTISDYSTDSYIEQYDYSQKNITEVEITQTSISKLINQTSKETYQLIYKDNKLIRKKYFSTPQKKEDRKIIRWIDYQYIFY